MLGTLDTACVTADAAATVFGVATAAADVVTVGGTHTASLPLIETLALALLLRLAETGTTRLAGALPLPLTPTLIALPLALTAVARVVAATAAATVAGVAAFTGGTISIFFTIGEWTSSTPTAPPPFIPPPTILPLTAPLSPPPIAPPFTSPFPTAAAPLLTAVPVSVFSVLVSISVSTKSSSSSAAAMMGFTIGSVNQTFHLLS